MATAGVTEATNATALSAAEKRVVDLDREMTHIDTRLNSQHFTQSDQKKLAQLKTDLGKAKAHTVAEIGARKALNDAYAASTVPKKEADPAVIAATKALAAVRKAAKPVLHAKKNLVNDVCQTCLSAEIDAVIDCNTPFFNRYGSGGGPAYRDCHEQTLGSYAGWNDLIKAKIKTKSEQNVLVAMSANEGDMDAVQAYDSEIVTMGAMQKTVNPVGQGELPKQLREFGEDPATKPVFDRVLGAKGYSVERTVLSTAPNGNKKYGPDVLYFKDPTDPNAKKITGAELDTFIQTHKERWPDMLGPFRALGRTPEFQRKQVLDFNDRLVTAMSKKPRGYQHPIGDYLTSERGAALVLDQDVNRPGYVSDDVGKGLDKFYQAHPTVSKDPASWPAANRAAWEQEIADNYSAVRRGTDMAGRAAKLGAQPLSAAPGSLVFP